MGGRGLFRWSGRMAGHMVRPFRYADSDSSQKPTVVLTSPRPESFYAFAPIWASLAEHAHLFAVDLPGCAKRPWAATTHRDQRARLGPLRASRYGWQREIHQDPQADSENIRYRLYRAAAISRNVWNRQPH